MRIRNDNNLPEPFVRAIRNATYDPGESDCTVTSLISPPQVRVLKNRYDNQIEADAADLVDSLNGQLFHLLLEQAGTESHEITEERFYVNCTGWKIGGQADLLDTANRYLLDYKRTKAKSFLYGIKDEWEQQLNLLDYLASRNGYTVESLWVMCEFRDWDWREAQRNSAYPQHRVQTYPIVQWGRKEQEEFLKEKIAEHQEAEKEGPRRCTEEEKWQKPEKWAVHRGQNKNASKVCNTREEAEEWVANAGNPTEYVIHRRPGEATRCLWFCPVSQFCQQAIEEGNA